MNKKEILEAVRWAGTLILMADCVFVVFATELDALLKKYPTISLEVNHSINITKKK